MDTTQDETNGRTGETEEALEELENADPAAAPDIAEQLADSLTAALEESEPAFDAPRERDDEEPR